MHIRYVTTMDYIKIFPSLESAMKLIFSQKSAPPKKKVPHSIIKYAFQRAKICAFRAKLSTLVHTPNNFHGHYKVLLNDVTHSQAS